MDGTAASASAAHPARPDLHANAGTVELPVAVCMERRTLAHRFLGEQWRAVAVAVAAGESSVRAPHPAGAGGMAAPDGRDVETAVADTARVTTSGVDNDGVPGAASGAPVDTSVTTRWWVPGLSLRLSRDEVLGYAQNLVAPEPRVFVLWRMRDDRAVPALLSASYDAGLRMFDSGERVDAVPLPPAIAAVMRDFVERHRDRLERDMQGERRRRVD